MFLFTYCNTVVVTNIVVVTVYSTLTLLTVTVIHTTGTNWKVTELFFQKISQIPLVKGSRAQTYGHAGWLNTLFKWVDKIEVIFCSKIWN